MSGITSRNRSFWVVAGLAVLAVALSVHAPRAMGCCGSGTERSVCSDLVEFLYKNHPPASEDECPVCTSYLGIGAVHWPNDDEMGEDVDVIDFGEQKIGMVVTMFGAGAVTRCLYRDYDGNRTRWENISGEYAEAGPSEVEGANGWSALPDPKTDCSFRWDERVWPNTTSMGGDGNLWTIKVIKGANGVEWWKGVSRFDGLDWNPASFERVYYPENGVTKTPTYSGGKLASMEAFPYLTLYSYDGDDAEKIEKKLNNVTVECTYIYNQDSGGSGVYRRRFTTVTYNSDGSKRLVTGVKGYFDSGANAGKVKFVVDPEGVGHLLADNPAVIGVNPTNPLLECHLDDRSEVSDADLEEYASVQYTYSGGKVSTKIVSGCGQCGGGAGAGTYTYAYGSNGSYPGSPTADQKYNLWKSYKRTTHPNGLREIEFRNLYGRNVFEVVQEMDGNTIDNTWITRTKYGSSGGSEDEVVEVRMPSACAAYTPVVNAGWTTDPNETDTGTVGLVKLYGYDANENLLWEKVRKGVTDTDSIEYYVRKLTYSEKTYVGHTVYHVATETEYPTPTTNPDASDRLVTSYTYTYHQEDGNDMLIIKTRKITYPKVAASQNGPGDGGGDPATEVTYHYRLADVDANVGYDLYYNDWTQHEDGTLSYTEYDDSTGTLAKTIRSVDTDETGDFNDLPAEWSDTDGLHLITSYEYDTYGRVKTTTHPGGRKSAVAYACMRTTGQNEETTTHLVTLRTEHVDGDGNYYYVPVSITVTNVEGEMVTSAAGVATSISDGNLFNDWDPNATTVGGAFGGTLTARTEYLYDNGHLEEVRRYHDLPSTPTSAGTLGTNYYRTFYKYDTYGRRTHTIGVATGTATSSSVEQVTKNVYDQRNRVTEVWRGVSDAAHNMTSDYDTDPNMVKVSASYYDESTVGSGTSGVGDGRVTSTRAYFGTGAAEYTYAKNYYDYRSRLRGSAAGKDSNSPVGPFVVTDYDHLGQPIAAAAFTSEESFGSKWATVLANPNYAATITTARGTLSKTLYDQKGRVYRTEVYAVSSGTAGKKLITDNYYDQRSRLVGSTSPGRGGTEYAYDGAGRQIETRIVTDLESTEYTSGAFNYRDPQPGAAVGGQGAGGDDQVIQIARTVYDSAGNATESIAMEMNHDDADGLDIENHDDMVQTAAYTWYDEVGRRTAVANYGTFDPDNEWTYADANTRTSSAPARADDVLVTSYAYDSAGRLETATDPNGVAAKYTYDDLGRTVRTEEDNGGATERWTLTQYDGLSNVVKRIADIDKDDGNISGGAWSTDADDQVTAYTFADAYSASLVTRIKYPDGDDANDNIDIEYHLDGSVSRRKLQKLSGQADRTEIAFVYDGLRRVVEQNVDTLGGVDSTVQSITYGYDTLGRRRYVTSHSDAAPDTTSFSDAVNQVEYAYNSIGAIDKVYQECLGKKDANTLYVQYNYDDANDGTKFTKAMRVASVRYPNSRLVHYTYGAADSIADKLSRVDAINADNSGSAGDVLTGYSYNGVGRMVVEDSNQPDVRLDYWGQTADTYAGFDRFGRVKDQLWRDYGGTPADRARYRYGYDRSSNRKWRENTLTSGKDEYYAYDRLDRLTYMTRGDLAGTYPNYIGISGAPTAYRTYLLDSMGNWTALYMYFDTTLAQTRTHNSVNEITGIDEYEGESWIDPAYDARGNMTTVPKPSDLDLAGGLTCAYDAWNRLTEVKQGQTVVAKYEYDGLNRRVKKHIDTQAPAEPNGVDVYQHFFYNEGWQILETREATSENDGPEGLNPEYQYVWSRRYIDAPVLRDENKDANSDCISGTDERLYYLTDAQMNVTALVDTGGDAVERYVYDPYGKVTIYDDDWSDTRSVSSYANPILFAGYYRDGETHLLHVRNRMYHPPLGRCLQRDPVEQRTAGPLNMPERQRLDIWEIGSRNIYREF